MSRLCIVLSVVAALFCKHADAFPDGAPVPTCISMAPNPNKNGGHGAVPQSSTAPYVIEVDKTYYNKNSSVKVYIKACGDVKIGGFILEAREKGNEKALGSFTTPAKTKALDCTVVDPSAETKNSVVTHSMGVGEKKLEFEWTPYMGSNATKHIYFVATVVQNRITYWLGIKSVEIWKQTPGKNYSVPNNPKCPGDMDGMGDMDGKEGDGDKDVASSAVVNIALLILAVSAKLFI